MRLMLLLALVGSAAHAGLELVANYKPTEACKRYMESVVAKSVVFPMNGEPARVLGSGTLADVVLEVGGTLHRNPLEVFEELVRTNPAAAADPIIVEAVHQMRNPVDPSKYAVVCLSGACHIMEKDNSVEGKHMSSATGLIRGGVTTTDLEASYRMMKNTKAPPPEIEAQVVSLKLPMPFGCNRGYPRGRSLPQNAKGRPE